MSKRKITILVCVLALAALAACSTATPSPGTGQAAQTTGGAAAAASPTGATAATVLAENTAPRAVDTSATDSSEAVAITLSGASIAADGAGVQVDGSRATITAAGTYRISGTLDDGQIVVDSEDDAPVQLILAGAAIRSATSAPIYVKQALSVTVILADGTQNSLADGATYVYASADEDEPNAALFSDDDLTITGGGALAVTGSYNDGIASKDGLTIAGGTIAVTAADDGIRGKDYLVVEGGSVTVQAGGDGLKSDSADDPAEGYIAVKGGALDITASGDGMQAETDLVVSAGDLSVVAGGGSGASVSADVSAKGLKAGVSLTLDGGTFAVSAADDALHADSDLTVNGGAFTIAAGDDGVHGETYLTVNGGDITITESYEGLESANITLNAGTVVLVSSDDGVNAASGDGAANEAGVRGGGFPPQGGPGGAAGGGSYTLAINGGTLVVDAAGDGLDANGTITMSDGLVVVNGPTERMNGALDYDGGFSISGGTLVAAGSAGMASAPGAGSGQNALMLFFTENQPAGTLVSIQNSAGAQVLTFAPSKVFQSLAFSSPALATGETYTVVLGGSASGDATAGLYSGAGYTPGTEYASFTVESALTQVGSGGGGGRLR